MEPASILLVEDHVTTRKLVRMCLERAGLQVREAKDGRTALCEMTRETPALVIQDLVLPDMDGFELALRLREAAAGKPVRIIAFSGLVSNLDAQRIADAGFDDVIAKPVETTTLLALVQRHLTAGGAAAPASEEGVQDEGNPLRGELMQRCSALSAELSILSSLSTAVLNASDVEGALVTALTTCIEATRCGACALYLLEPHGHLRVRRLGRCTPDSPGLATFYGYEAWLRALMKRGDVMLLSRDDPCDPVVTEVLARADLTNALLIPLTGHGTALGALLLALASDVEPSELARVRWFAEGVASQVTHALTLARAFREREVAERAAEQQRRLANEQTAMWRSLVEHAPDLVMHVDFDGRLRFVNRELEQAPGTARPDSWFDLVAVDYHAALREALAQVAREQKAVTLETSEVDVNGSLRWTESHLGPVRIGDESAGALVIQRDTTEKKQSEAQLIMADRLASVGALVGGVAHEINNPLSSVLANLELALRELSSLSLPKESEVLEGLRDAREAADRVRRIVQDLRIFSRADEERRSVVDLESLLESALRLMRSEIHYRARLVKKIAKVPPVEANEAQLGQVLLNLVANATRAIEPGAVARNEISIELACDDGETIVLSIRDSGCGISPSARARLFTAFGNSKPGTGLGLGLSLSRRIIEALGGTLACESEPGQGSLFRLTLPACRPRAATRAPQRAHASAARRGRVLVLDDEPLVSEVVRRTLAAEHDVLMLESTIEALARIRAGERFDVVLCDLIMPQMTGMDFHDALARAYPEQAARVVFVTAGAFIPRARQFLDGLPNPHLHKPLDAEALRSVVNGMVR